MSFSQFTLLLSRDLKVLFSQNSFWLLENELLIENPTKKQISHVNWEKDMEAPEFFQVLNPD